MNEERADVPRKCVHDELDRRRCTALLYAIADLVFVQHETLDADDLRYLIQKIDEEITQ